MTPGSPEVGICVLNHGQPEATVACIASLLAREPDSTRILWLESPLEGQPLAPPPALTKAPFPSQRLDPASDPLPPSGVVGLIVLPDNLGYAGGNNVALRYLRGRGVPYAWLLNNDTLLLEGDSRSLVGAAESHPAVGLWGTALTSQSHGTCLGHVLREVDYRARPSTSLQEIEQHPWAYISGCSLFLRTEIAAGLGYLPEDYFLYYEDAAFSQTARRAGLGISVVPAVRLWHHEGLATGRQGPLATFYNARNRWFFVQRHVPGALPSQLLRHAYHLQKLLFRGRFEQLRLEWLGFREFRRGRTGRLPRSLRRSFRA